MRSVVFAKVLSVAAALAMVMGVAGAMEYSPNTGADRWNSVGGIGDVRSDNQVTGELYADVMAGSVSIQREFRRALPSIYSYSQTAHMQNRADIGSDAAYANTAEIVSEAYAICPTTMCAPGAKWVMWDVPWLMRETEKVDDGYSAYRSSSSGFATGVSYMLGNASAIGLAVGYDARKLDFRDNMHQQNRADTLHLALYGGTSIGNLFIDGYAGWSHAWNRAERNIDDPAGVETLKSKYNDDVFSAGLKASYVWILDNEVRVTPSVGVDFSHVKMDGFRERAHRIIVADYSLRGHNSSYTSVSAPVAVSINKTICSDFLTFKGAQSLWTPELRAGWTPQFGRKHAAAKLSNPTGAIVPAANRTISTLSNPVARSHGTVGAGLKIKLADKFIFAVDYDYTFAKGYSNHSVTGMYGVSF